MFNTFDVVSVALNPAVDLTVWIPDFGAGKVNRVQREQTDAGGKGPNVASFLADYGLRVAITGLRGAGNAEIFRAHFARKGITDRFVDIPGNTRTGIKVVDPVREQTTDINFPGLPASPGQMERLRRILDDLIAECDWFVFSGALPPGAPPTLYRELIGALKAQAKRVVLDTSGEALRLAMAAVPDIVKPNQAELSELVGRPLETTDAILAAARDLLGLGIGRVVVSMGERGALFVARDEAVLAMPPRVEVKSTVGAGDAMVAGTVAGVLRGLPLPEIARMATASAAGALTQVSHNLPPQGVIDALMAQVTILAAG